ncbi:MAG: hypothetical protein EHM70_06350 [Chloroflexota bacterium]|nr:MAG: hypothetical protein EHM70_06350 [Chloroflexota bacterium]
MCLEKLFHGPLTVCLMKNHIYLIIGFCLLAMLVAGSQLPAAAAPKAQFTPFPTPTPGPDGRIIYLALENDSAWRIAAIFGLSLDELRTLNKWGENPIIAPGDQVLLGFAGPADSNPTPGPTSTPTPSAPTPTLQSGSGKLCVILFDDLNGDAYRQEEEISIPGGAISITDRSGDVSKTADTESGTEYQCYEELPEGNYNVSVAVPDGYNPTTVMNYALRLKAGDTTLLPFGAQKNTVAIAEAPVPRGTGKSPMFGIIGALFLVSAFGLAIFAGRMARKTR